MMIFLLLCVVAFYAGYNLFVKVASETALSTASTTIVATITLQVFALLASFTFAAVLLVRGNENFNVGTGALAWAALAGLCIGAAEIAYFYIFRGFSDQLAMPAGIVIPIVVAGTVVITMVLSIGLFNESIGVLQGIGLALIVCGSLLLIKSA